MKPYIYIWCLVSKWDRFTRSQVSKERGKIFQKIQKKGETEKKREKRKITKSSKPNLFRKFGFFLRKNWKFQRREKLEKKCEERKITERKLYENLKSETQNFDKKNIEILFTKKRKVQREKTDKLRRRKIEKREFWKMMNLISEEDIGEIDKELFETTGNSAT